MGTLRQNYLWVLLVLTSCVLQEQATDMEVDAADQEVLGLDVNAKVSKIMDLVGVKPASSSSSSSRCVCFGCDRGRRECPARGTHI